MASIFLPSSSSEKSATTTTTSFLHPPPPYEKAIQSRSNSFSSQLSNFVFKKGGDSINDNSTAVTQTTIDKKQIEQVITLIHIAAEMEQAGNHQMAKDLYVMGVDRMLSALPLESDPQLKLSLEYRLAQFRNSKQLNLDQPFEETMMAIANCKEINEDEENDQQQKAITLSSRIGTLVTSMTEYGVDVFKKSPIPGAVYYSMTYAKASIEAVDAKLHISQHTWNLAVKGMAKAMEVNRHYEIHRIVLDKLLLTCQTLIQAAIDAEKNNEQEENN
ncbi:hypothetical protein BJ944DRAFT_163336 [Cunninghamella echinulata]|nr:hypothetical protein BJ944DRAFT_163336 [Cunninghamella echinulata]